MMPGSRLAKWVMIVVAAIIVFTLVVSAVIFPMSY